MLEGLIRCWWLEIRVKTNNRPQGEKGEEMKIMVSHLTHEVKQRVEIQYCRYSS